MNNTHSSTILKASQAVLQSLWHYKVLPTSESDRRKFGRWFKYADFQPVGLFLKAGKEIKFSLRDTGFKNITLQMIVGTYGFNTTGSDTESPRVYDLKLGDNRVVDKEGGLLWLRVVSDNPDALSSFVDLELNVSDSVYTVPVFIQGSTNIIPWIATLLEYAKMPDERAPVQMMSDKVVITTWCSTALKFILFNPSDVLDEYATILRVENEIANIGTHMWQDSPSPLRILISEKESGNPNATDFRISLPQYDSAILTAKGVREEWGVWHELGHMQQQIAWLPSALIENSVNIYSLAWQRAMKKYSRAAAYNEAAQTFLKDSNPDKKFEDNDEFVRLIMWEQLRRVYSENFFHRLHSETRKRGDSDRNQSDAQRRHYFMVACASAAEENLGNFYTRWGLKPTQATLEAINHLPKPGLEPSSIQVPAETEILTVERQSDMFKITGIARAFSRIKTTNDPDSGWYDPEDGPVHADLYGNFSLLTGRLVDGKAVVMSFDPLTDEKLFESNHLAIDKVAAAKVFVCGVHEEVAGR